MINVGKVLKAHGLRGALVISVDPSLGEPLQQGAHVELRATGTKRTLGVVSASTAPGGHLVRLDGITDRTDADLMVGAEVFMQENDLPALSEGEYYEHDIVGCRVISNEGTKPDSESGKKSGEELGKELGVVTEVLKTSANDIYVITSESGEILAPAVEGVIIEIDTRKRLIHVEADGLEYSGADKR